MSAVKFAYQPYKLFETVMADRRTDMQRRQPQFHAERPIIVDADDIESPETVTLRYEEEAAARANGGGLRGDSPPGLLSMSAAYAKPQPPQMHDFDAAARSYQDAQYQYPQHSFAAHQSQNAAAAQLNHMAFAANGSTGPYMAAPAPVVPTVLSYEPNAGMADTKLVIRLSASYDIQAIGGQFVVGFGDFKCPAHVVLDTHDASGFVYVASTVVPPLEDTRFPRASVPLTLQVDNGESNLMGNLMIDVGTFTYHAPEVGVPVGSPHEGVTRAVNRHSLSPEHQSPPKQEHQIEAQSQQQPQPQITEDATNSYGYPPVVPDQQAAAPSYDPAYTDSSNGSMMSTYHHRPSYGGDYRHIPPPVKSSSSAWNSYGSSYASMRSPSMHGIQPITHTTITRPSLSSLPAPNGNAPQLVRTSTLQTSSSPGSSQYNPYALYSTKAVLKIAGDLESMASGWTSEEYENRRRIVLFKKQQTGSTLTTTFKPVSVNERPTNSVCISCIYWKEKQECFVTSVDTIYLLEQLVAAPARFTVEEKNRIRRNLEGFRPLTVSKAKADSEEFFKIIMGFPNPKPRNIEKDVKVFPWKILAQALKKIISKYSASPSSTLPAGPGPSLLTPVSSTSPGLYGPAHTPRGTDSYSRSSHPIYGSSLEEYEQARTQGGLGATAAASNWAPYPAPARVPDSPPLKPTLSQHSAGGGIRVPSLPSYGADATGRHHTHQTHAHHHVPTTQSSYDMASQAQARWGDPAVSTAYLDTPTYAGHHHPSQLYGTYGDGGQRA